MQYKNIEIVQDIDKAIEVLCDASTFLSSTSKNVSKWWTLENLNRDFLTQHADPDEFYVALVNDQPAACVVLQHNEINAEDWSHVTDGEHKDSLYVHWLATKREFAGQNLSALLIDFAIDIAKERGLSLIRLDVDADNGKLRDIYERLGFTHILDADEGYRTTSFYQKRC